MKIMLRKTIVSLAMFICISSSFVLGNILQSSVVEAQDAPFDYSLFALGGRTVQQGKTLYLFFGTKVVSGTVPYHDMALLTITGIPKGFTLHSPLRPTCCSTFPINWDWIGSNTAYNHMTIEVDPTVAPGSYTLTFTVASALEGLTRSLPVTINVFSPSQFTLSKKPYPPAVPIPKLSLWEQEMKTAGKFFCNQADIYAMGTYTACVWFYDGERVFYQIADYTGDPSWNQCALWVQDVYRPTIITNKGIFSWIGFFTKGFRMNYEKTGDAVSQQAITLMAQANDYASPISTNQVEDQITMREVSYGLEALLDSEAVNHMSLPKTTAMMEILLGQLDQVFMSKTYTWYQPFMAGLACEALIQYYNEKNPDPRIPYHIKKALDRLWDQGWVAGSGSFAYRCYDNGCYTPTDGSIDPPTGPATVPNIVYMNRLNNLIAPAYAWLFLQTGDPLYRQRGDDLFANIAKDPVWLSPGQGKEFSQTYRWSFDYVKYRQQANALAAAVSDTEPPTVSAAAPVIDTVFDSVAGQTITPSQYATTYTNASGIINMVAVANDNTDIAAVQFQIDGVNAGPPVLSRPFESSYASQLLSNGAHMVTAIAYDLAGNSAVSAPISLNVNNPVNAAELSCPTDAIPTGSFQGCYYNHSYTSNYLNDMYYNIDGNGAHYPPANLGTLTVTRNDSAINFNWNNGKGGSTSPAPGVGSSFFAVVWQGNFNFNAGTYTFNAARDNGMRVFVDGVMEINKWWSDSVPIPPFNVTFFKPGTHLIRVEYWKGYGDSPATVSLSWSELLPDNTAPSVPTSLSATAVSSSKINLSWSPSNDDFGVAGYRVYRDGNQIANTTQTKYQNTGLSPSTTYSYTVAAYDTAGNPSAQSAPASVTTFAANITDMTPPVISNINAAPGRTTTVVSWTTNAPSNSSVNYGTSVSLGMVASDSALVISHSISLGNLSETTLYYYSVRSCTATGNCNTSSIRNFTTTPSPDVTPPTVLIISPSEGVNVNGVVTINANASDNIGISHAEFYKDGTLLETDYSFPYTFAWNTVSESNGQHTLMVRAVDTSGNPTTNTITVNVSNQQPSDPSGPSGPSGPIFPTPPDTTPPTTPANLAAKPVSSSRINLSWSASTDNVGVKGYKIYRNGVQIATVKNISYNDTDLPPEVTYTYAVLAYDISDNPSGMSLQVSAMTLLAEAPPPAGANENGQYGQTDNASAKIGLFDTAADMASRYPLQYLGFFGVFLALMASVLVAYHRMRRKRRQVEEEPAASPLF